MKRFLCLSIWAILFLTTNSLRGAEEDFEMPSVEDFAAAFGGLPCHLRVFAAFALELKTGDLPKLVEEMKTLEGLLEETLEDLEKLERVHRKVRAAYRNLKSANAVQATSLEHAAKTETDLRARLVAADQGVVQLRAEKANLDQQLAQLRSQLQNTERDFRDAVARAARAETSLVEETRLKLEFSGSLQVALDLKTKVEAEREKFRLQVESLTGELNDLKATVAGQFAEELKGAKASARFFKRATGVFAFTTSLCLAGWIGAGCTAPPPKPITSGGSVSPVTPPAGTDESALALLHNLYGDFSPEEWMDLVRATGLDRPGLVPVEVAERVGKKLEGGLEPAFRPQRGRAANFYRDAEAFRGSELEKSYVIYLALKRMNFSPKLHLLQTDRDTLARAVATHAQEPDFGKYAGAFLDARNLHSVVQVDWNGTSYVFAPGPRFYGTRADFLTVFGSER